MSSPFALAAPLWTSRWNVLALVGKRPIEPRWQRWCVDRQPPNYLNRWVGSPLSYNIGLPLGQNGLLAIDVDTDVPDHLSRIINVLPPIAAAKRGRRGFTAFYRAPTGTVPTSRWGIVEVLSHGTQTVIPPSIHPDTGRPFVWLNPRGLEG